MFAPVESNGRRIQRGRISVRDGVKQHGYAGWADRNHWSCRVTLRRDIYPGIALHELLHYLGLDHDDGADDSVMGEYAGSKLSRDNVDYVRGLMGLGPSAAPETPDVLAEVPAPEADAPGIACSGEVPAETDAADLTEEPGVSLPPDFTIPDIRVSL